MQTQRTLAASADGEDAPRRLGLVLAAVVAESRVDDRYDGRGSSSIGLTRDLSHDDDLMTSYES